jgi:hypothetical protein
MKNEELIKQLIRFKDKAFCSYTHEQASSIWAKIRNNIPHPYNRKISTEWSHVQLGHGYQQAKLALDEEIKNFINHLKD